MFEFWTFNINKIKLGLGPNATPSNNVSNTRGMMVSRGRVSAASTDSVGSGGSSGGGGGPLSSNQNLYNTSHVHNVSFPYHLNDCSTHSMCWCISTYKTCLQ